MLAQRTTALQEITAYTCLTAVGFTLVFIDADLDHVMWL